jgi:hypothetical protein
MRFVVAAGSYPATGEYVPSRFVLVKACFELMSCDPLKLPRLNDIVPQRISL